MPHADSLFVFKHAGHKSAEHAEEINGTIRCLQQVDNFDWLPPSLAFYKLHRTDSASILRFLLDIERLAMSMMIRRVNINSRINRYGLLLNSIEHEDDLFAKNSTLQLKEEECSETLEALDGDVYLVTKIRKAVLLRLDQFLGDEMAIYEHKYITVEHELPQNPSSGSTWLNDFPENKEREELLHKIGNLLLLSHKTNASANNRPFKEKKNSYFAKGDVSTFALTTNVITEASWTPEVIRRRQKMLLDVFRQGWRL